MHNRWLETRDGAPLVARRALPGQFEACGLAEPHHATSVNGRAAEPI